MPVPLEWWRLALLVILGWCGHFLLGSSLPCVSLTANRVHSVEK
jgi:hypothetical protein